LIKLTKGSSGLGSAMSEDIDKRMREIVSAGDQAPEVKIED